MLIVLFTEPRNSYSSRTLKFLLNSLVRLLSPAEDVPVQQLHGVLYVCMGHWAQEGYQKCYQNPKLANLNIIRSFPLGDLWTISVL